MTDTTSERGTSGMPSSQNRAPFSPGYRSSWALIIGINYSNHPHINPLENAEADASAIRDVLQQTYGFPAEQMLVLIGEDATRDNILRALRDTLSNAAQIDANDRMLIFFAGHGVIRETPKRNERSERRGYILPVDDNGEWARRIEMKDFRDAWENIPAKHILIILDACYSGMANKERSIDGIIRPFDNIMTQYEARQIITAGTSDQRIADVFQVNDEIKSQHSYLSNDLVDVLQNGLPKGELITAERLYEYLRESVFKKSGNRQRPQFGSYGDEQGVVLLHPPEVRIPRNIYEGLHSTVDLTIQSTLVELRQLFNSIARLEQPGVTDDETVEQWRKEILSHLFKIFSSNENTLILSECGTLMRDILLGSPTLQKRYAAELVKMLGDDNIGCVQQAAIILSALAGDSPTQSVVFGKIETNGSNMLEVAMVNGNNEVIVSVLRLMIKIFPATALPWMRLMLIDPQASNELHYLIFEALPTLGNLIDLRMLHQAINRRPMDRAYRSRATESLLSLLKALQQKDKDKEAVDQTGLRVANEVLEHALKYDINSDLRRRVLEILVLTDSPKLFESLSSALVDPDAVLRADAYRLFASLPVTSPHIDNVLSSYVEILANEPLALVRAAACVSLGEIWKNTTLSSIDPSILMKRVAILEPILAKTLNDANLEVQRAAASALGVSGDLTAVTIINDYVSRGMVIKQVLSPMLEDLTDPKQIEQISDIVPPMFGELIESFQQLQTVTTIDTQDKGHNAIANVEHLLRAAEVFGEPTFMPLIQDWLRNPPEKMLTDTGEFNARASLYILALQALGKQPRSLAMPLAEVQVNRALQYQEQFLPVLPTMAETLAILGGIDAMNNLANLIDQLQLPTNDTETTRITAADGILRIFSTTQVSTPLSERLQTVAITDPSERVRKILSQLNYKEE